MGADMLYRDLYHPTDRPLDFDLAKATASRLARSATLQEVSQFLAGDWTSVDANPSDDHTEQVRRLVEDALHERLDQFAASLTTREVRSFRFDRDDQPGVQAYVTGGLSSGDSPTDAYTAWDIVTEHDRLPDGWGPAICTALGLIHPCSAGPTVTTVRFRAWN